MGAILIIVWLILRPAGERWQSRSGQWETGGLEVASALRRVHGVDRFVYLLSDIFTWNSLNGTTCHYGL